MTQIRIVIRFKVPDETGDKELQEIFKKYLEVHPTKTVSMRHAPDSIAWLVL